MNFLERVVEYWQIFTSYIGRGVQWMRNGVRQVAVRLFGETRVTHVAGTVREQKERTRSFVHNRFSERFDDEGRHFSLIYKIYKYAVIFLVGSLIYYLILITNFLGLTGGMPSIEDLQNPKMAEGSLIISADGVNIGRFFEENRVPVDSSEISPWVYKALIATEDVRFFNHSGIDLRSWFGVAAGMLTGGERGGGSTISQQLAKNLYNTRKEEKRGWLSYIPVVRTIIYKTKEWITAVELEKRFTKGEIATMYLNKVDYGKNSFGIKTAARTYFDKEPIDLKPEEAAVLVGLQKATTLYNPIKNPKNATRRRNTVLQLMAKNGSLTQAEADKLSEKPLKLNVNFDSHNNQQNSYFADVIYNYIQKWSEENDKGIDVNTDGLRIYTTIDSRMQSFAEEAMRKQMKVLQKEFDLQWKGKNPWVFQDGKEIPGFIDTVAKRTVHYRELARRYNNNRDSINKYMNMPVKMKVFSYEGTKEMTMSHMDSLRYYKRFLQSGMMAMEPYSGYIKAWVGGIDYEHFQYDHVKQGRRQPGSTFKPVLYAAAIDGPKNLSPCYRLKDEPVKAEWEENGVKKVWEPKNANGRFSYSNMTLRRALAQSVNSIAVQLTLDILPKTVVEYGKKLGITSPLESVGSIGLGTSDVSLYEMVAAYGVFANEGNYSQPILITKIEDKNGKLIAEFEPKIRQAISQESAFLMQFMLRGNVEEGGGTGRRMLGYPNIFKNQGQLGGKTGTTSNHSDAWYICFTKDLVAGSWVGGDDRSIHFRSSMGEGSKSALPIVGLFLDKVYGTPKLGYKPGPFPKPSITIEKEYENCSYSSGGGSSRRYTDYDDYDYGYGDSSGRYTAPDTSRRRRLGGGDTARLRPVQNRFIKKDTL